MKTQRNILIAFILNLSFSVFEFIGGIITGSVAIISDAIHDTGDAVSIGISYFLEKKSKKQPDEKYTFGYSRYSVLGGFISTLILLIGSAIMIINAINRIINPTLINYTGMIVFAVVGVCVNLCAALFTHHKGSLNQRAVNLHMLEDALGWIVVLIGAVIMKFTNISVIDPIMSICVSAFIFFNAAKNMKEIFDLFLQKAPENISIEKIKTHITEIDGVISVHHIHLWSMDSNNNFASLHVVTDCDTHDIKDKIRKELHSHGICHVTIETEKSTEHCHDKECHIETNTDHHHGHHHHHHH